MYEEWKQNRLLSLEDFRQSGAVDNSPAETMRERSQQGHRRAVYLLKKEKEASNHGQMAQQRLNRFRGVYSLPVRAVATVSPESDSLPHEGHEKDQEEEEEEEKGVAEDEGGAVEAPEKRPLSQMSRRIVRTPWADPSRVTGTLKRSKKNLMYVKVSPNPNPNPLL